MAAFWPPAITHARTVAVFAVLAALLSRHGVYWGTVEHAVAWLVAGLVVAIVVAIRYVVWFAREIRGDEVLSVWWNRHVIADAKQRCAALYPAGHQFDFADQHYTGYMFQDEPEENITWYDRIIARQLSFLCWPSTCFADDIARAFLAQRPGPDDVLLDVGCGLGLAMLTFKHHLPCKRVHGIELDEQLYTVCSRNLEVAGGKENGLTCERADATTFELPDDVTLVYMYNSLQDDLNHTRRQQHTLFVGRIRASLDRAPRTITLLLYDCDDCDDVDEDDDDEEDGDTDNDDGDEDVKALYNEAFELKAEGSAGPDSFCVYVCS